MAFVSLPGLDETMGAMLLGVMFGALPLILYQSRSFKQCTTSCMVIVVVTLDAIHQALIIHTIYTYLVLNFNNRDSLNECVWLTDSQSFRRLSYLPVPNRPDQGVGHGKWLYWFPSAMVYTFALHSDYSLMDTFPDLIFLASSVTVSFDTGLVVSELACVTTFAIIGLTKIRTFEDLTHLRALSITMNTLTAAGDILIAASFSVLLWTQKTGLGVNNSNAMINRLIGFSINTVKISSVSRSFAVAAIVSITTAPRTNIYIFFFFNIGRLYVNSFLATLNGRGFIRNLSKTNDTNQSLSTGSIIFNHACSARTSNLNDCPLSESITDVHVQQPENVVTTCLVSSGPESLTVNKNGTGSDTTSLSVTITATQVSGLCCSHTEE
ncbi:hypothetical protein K435DRAFT_809266 [Dendrothele bispora CBS 962.96]|uniref:DUF6534 domain-containing protein n=1 Tax=Dendrothele bispora (strain CBS 962.96) TaxID=1314807 RepID=A0A4S8KYR8_DENBC|nr:hypothetical protein K435DRAFT_809266 [Dendrothele bispora CBS 962.96]